MISSVSPLKLGELIVVIKLSQLSKARAEATAPPLAPMHFAFKPPVL
jgi:hypothetical protein